MRLTHRLGLQQPICRPVRRPEQERPAARPRLEALEDRAVPSFGFGWAFNVGGPNLDSGWGIATDASGNVYVAGQFSGTNVNFNPLATPSPLSSQTSQDDFVAKYSAAGVLQWVTDLGSFNRVDSVAVSGSGSSVYVGGPGLAQLDASTGSVIRTVSIPTVGSWPMDVAVGPMTGNVYVTSTTSTQAFVAKYDASLNWQWTTSTTGGTAKGQKLAVYDAPNNGPEFVAVIGSYTGSVTFGATPLSSWSGTEDAFVWKLNADGTSAWAGGLGSDGDDWGGGIAVDGSGNLYATGGWGDGSRTASQNNNFDPGPGVIRLTNSGGGRTAVFVVKLVPTNGGTAYTTQSPGWAKSISGNGFDAGSDVAVGGAGNVYTVGEFGGSANFDPGPGKYILKGGGSDVFVSELDSGGNFVAAVGTTATTRTSPYDFGNAIALAGSNVYTTGELGAGGTDNFDPTTGTDLLTSNGSRDIFVWKLTQAGTPTPTRMMDPIGPSAMPLVMLSTPDSMDRSVTGRRGIGSPDQNSTGAVASQSGPTGLAVSPTDQSNLNGRVNQFDHLQVELTFDAMAGLEGLFVG
jgi:hypothetical protein